ncbi:hypothetical protein ACH49M_21595 [Rhodococcus qingshengii]|uniref:hypothetical protein n=1 Tax=Rhodococcus qingshengii TaxID=334542 RepID=UPI003702F471
MSQGVDTISEGIRRVSTLKQELDDFYVKYKESLRAVDINFQTELHKYACIRLAGFLEQLFFISIDAYVRATAGPKASSFGLFGWKKAPNLGPEALERLVSRFSSDEWNASLASLIDGGNFKGELGVLLKIRNNSAHGQGYTGSIRSVDAYKNMIDQIYGWVLITFLDRPT